MCGSEEVCYRLSSDRLPMASRNRRSFLLYSAVHPDPGMIPLAPRLTTLMARPLGMRPLLQELANVMSAITAVRLVGSPGLAASRHLIPRFGRMIPLLMSLRLLFREDLVTMLPPIGGMQL